MVYKLKPLELGIDLEDREYELGDAINVQVTLTPNGDVRVRQARVDLVCEETYTRSERGIVMGVGGAQGIQGGNPLTTTDYVSGSSWTNQRTESYVHSSVVLLEDTTLRSGSPITRSARLQIRRELPKHFDEAAELQRDANSSWSFKWRLLARVNVFRGRDQKRQRTLAVKLPPAPAGARVGAKPRMSTPKKSTGHSS
jgi:hypothetical protein